MNNIQALDKKPRFSGLKAKDIIFFFVSLTVLIATFAAVIYYICGPSRGYFHADCTDSLYWANASVESGKLIADNFRYAAILPFSANVWMIPLIMIFGVSMKTQIISMVIFAVLYIASQIWAFRSLKFSWSLSFIASSIMLMILSSSVKMREIMWEHVIYYSLSIVFFNCLLALSLRLFRAWDKHRIRWDAKSRVAVIIYAVLLSLVCIPISTNGLPVIIMTTFPIWAGILGELFFSSREKLFSTKNSAKLFAIGIIPSSTVVGYVILQIIKGNVIADYTNTYSRFASSGSWSNNLLKFPAHFATLIGFNDDLVDFLSVDGIRNLFVICTFAVIVLAPIVALFFYKKLRKSETKIALLAHTALFAAIMFIFVFGNISGVNWRLVPLVATSAISTLCIINEFLCYRKEMAKEKDSQKSASRLPVRTVAIMLVILCVFSLFNFVDIVRMPADYGQNNIHHLLARKLEDNGLEYGYATFWNSQAITLLSDSKVKCREILATSEDGAKTDYYQSSFDWYEPQENVNTYFVLLSDKEYSRVFTNSTWRKWEAEQLKEKITDIPGYTIFVFDGYLEGIK